MHYGDNEEEARWAQADHKKVGPRKKFMLFLYVKLSI